MIERFWEAIGGRKFLALCLACGVYVCRGSFDFNLALIFAAYMGANVLTKFINGKNGKGEMNREGGRR
jgi:hypothetical protein